MFGNYAKNEPDSLDWELMHTLSHKLLPGMEVGEEYSLDHIVEHCFTEPVCEDLLLSKEECDRETDRMRRNVRSKIRSKWLNPLIRKGYLERTRQGFYMLTENSLEAL